MQKKAVSFVLASLKGSTYNLGKRLFSESMGGPGENWVRLASSLAAASLNTLFEHPAHFKSEKL